MKKLSNNTPRNIRNKKAGSVMMEYVILAVMIAAAVVFAAQMFGDSIVDSMDGARKAMQGETQKAADHIDTSIATADTGFQTARERANDVTKED